MQILTFPSNELRKKAVPVTKEMVTTDDLFKNKLKEMIEIAKQDGIGLAATQVGWHVSLFVSLVNERLEKMAEPQVFLNPRITQQAATKDLAVEGCLSVPGFEDAIARPVWIRFEWEDLAFHTHVINVEYSRESKSGYFIRLLQHETDHLNGILFIDHLDATGRSRFNEWFRRQKK